MNSLFSILIDSRLIENLKISPDQSIDEILNGRDSQEFEARWINSYSAIESRKKHARDLQLDLSKQIREEAYLRVFARWKSPDLAACISDDFGLIADAATLSIVDTFVESLLRCYQTSTIPWQFGEPDFPPK